MRVDRQDWAEEVQGVLTEWPQGGEGSAQHGQNTWEYVLVVALWYGGRVTIRMKDLKILKTHIVIKH